MVPEYFLGNTRTVSPGCVARFLRSHQYLLTLEYDNMRDVLVYLVDQQLCPKFQSNLRKMVLENCREDMEKVLEDSIESFPLLEALRYDQIRKLHTYLRFLKKSFPITWG